MNIHDLPIWATAYPGESRWSWLEATRVRMGLPEREWQRWADCCNSEPERSSSSLNWVGSPSELGDITHVAPSWRVSPPWRRIYCPNCRLMERGSARYPVLIEWLDVRAIVCERHDLLLCHMALHEPRTPTFDAEIEKLSGWLSEWRYEVPVSSQDSYFRRDLLIASGRNWSSRMGDIASIELAWVLHSKGWLLATAPGLQPAGWPARIGMLCPVLRVAALLGAFRAWNAMNGENLQHLPRWPTEAWGWLLQRSQRRGDPERRLQQLEELKLKTSLRSKPDDVVRR